MTWPLRILLWIFGLATLASFAVTGVPAARHMAGIVVMDAQAPVTIRRAAPLEIGPILALAPFGSLKPTAQTPVASETLPDLALKGVILSEGAKSAALISVGDVVGAYSRDAVVAQGLRVSDISAQYVTLANAKTTITLTFDDSDAAPAQAPPVAASANDLMSRMLASRTTAPKKRERQGKPTTTSEYIDHWRKRIRRNPQAVLDRIGLQATDEGYVIKDQHDSGVRLAGFKAGDLVRSVNGRAVGNPDDDRLFYDDIAAAGHARVEVQRGDRLLSFSFPLR